MLLKGKNVSRETIKNKKDVIKVVIKESFKDPVLSIIEREKIECKRMKDNDFNKMYGNEAQGIVVYAKDYEYYDLDELLTPVNNNSLCVILDNLEDPQNLGNIIRTFDALGGSFIIIPKNHSISVNETVAKVSAGSYNYVKIAQVTNLNNAIKKLKDKGYWVMGTDMKGDTNYDEVRVDMPICLIIGSEGFGMSKLVKDNCDFLLKIPMVGKINCLNASISLAICMSDIQSRRRKL